MLRLELTQPEMRRITMRAWSAVLLVLLVCGLLGGTLALAAADKDTRLAGGEIMVDTRSVPGSKYQEGTVTALIPAPVDDVWDVLADLNQYPCFMPRVSKCSIDKAKSTSTSLVATTVLNFGLAKVKYTLSYDLDQVSHIMRWSLVESPDLKTVKGSWVLQEQHGKTLAVYTTFVEPGSIANLPFFSSIYKKRSVQDLPLVMKAVRDRVGSLQASAARP